MSDDIRVFVGSAARYRVSEAVMVRSLLDHASREVRIEVIDGEQHTLRDVSTGATTPLPDEWRGRIQGDTSYTFARFAPPALCGFEGRCIYVESDMLAVGDITELWDVPLHGAALAAVPHAKHRGEPSPFQTEGHMSSVVVYEAGRCRRLDPVTVTDGIEAGRFSWADAICMTDRFLDEMQLEIASLPARWNDLERRLPDSAIVHFTDFRRHPWSEPRQPASSSWTEAYLRCVAHGDLARSDLVAARQSGSISRRVATLPSIPEWCRRPLDAVWQRAEYEVAQMPQVHRRLWWFTKRCGRRARRAPRKLRERLEDRRSP